MRKTRIVLMVFGLVVALYFVLSFLESRSEPIIRAIGDSMDWRSQWLMGPRGIDCGRVKIDGDPKPATDCALKAQREGRPFRVRYDILGYDSAVAGGIARTPSGKVYALSFDGNPSGAGGTSLLDQHSIQSPCPEPTHLWVNPKGRINCFQEQLSYPSGVTSPNLEPY